jgi:hypothetical protein
VLDSDWTTVKTFLPKNWEWLARRNMVLKGLRKDREPEQVLRPLLIHLGCGYSLRETATRVRQSGIADLSEVGLFKRLIKSKDWLSALCVSLMKDWKKDHGVKYDLEYRLFDSTLVKEPGQTGSQWRIHYSVRIPSLRCDFFKLTSACGKGNGDTLVQFPVKAGDYIVADRGYSQSSGICHVVREGAHVCVRVNPDGMQIFGQDRKPLCLLERMVPLREAGQMLDFVALLRDARGAFAEGRICALRKSELAIEAAQAKLRRRAQKNGEKLKPETLEFAKYVILFTTFPQKSFPVSEVLEGYRYRWQIELIFKRFKQIAQIGHLPKRDDDSAEAWLYGKLFVALLTQRMVEHASLFSPWGYDLARIESAKPLARV